MTHIKTKLRPIRLQGSGKLDVRTQFGALCWRKKKGEVQILLVTRRRSGRWTIPKGWPMNRTTPARAASLEAWEEAGAVGKGREICLGIYTYTKAIPGQPPLPCVVAVFPMKVKSLTNDWPEARQRKRKWVKAKKAAALVRAPELKRILREFDPDQLPK